MVLSGCCSYDKKDLEFNDKELAYFNDYKIGDTIYFQSNLADNFNNYNQNQISAIPIDAYRQGKMFLMCPNKYSIDLSSPI